VVGLLNIAHRGASRSCPENTIAAFVAAADAAAAMCELDVRLSRDGIPVVIHDETVNRTTDGRGAVAAMSLNELKRLDAGVRFGRQFVGERIPTLDEVFDALGDRCGLDIELKDGAADAQVCAIIRERRAYDSTVVSSFDWAALRRVKTSDTSIRIGVLADKRPELMIAEAGELGAWSVNPRYTLCTAELVSEAHRNAFKVLVWTIDDPAHMRRMIASGVDGIVTNDPKRLGTLLR
jgi:glycerophosphoryl diester phosphodiesterase